MNSKNKNIRDPYRGITKFKSGYQRTSSLMKDENGDSFADSHSNLNFIGSICSEVTESSHS
jgi:hypothetical protein